MDSTQWPFNAILFKNPLFLNGRDASCRDLNYAFFAHVLHGMPSWFDTEIVKQQQKIRKKTINQLQFNAEKDCVEKAKSAQMPNRLEDAGL